MTTKKKNSKSNRVAVVTQLIAGARKHFPNGGTALTLEGASTTIDAVAATMQAAIDNRAAVVTAQATARAALVTETAGTPAVDAMITAFEAFVRLTFGSQSAALADFGMTPPKEPTPMTVDEKAVAAAKRKATRAARGTAGPKQKKSVKGNVTATVVVTAAPAPPAAPAPAVAAAAPAAAAPGGSTTSPTPHTGG